MADLHDDSPLEPETPVAKGRPKGAKNKPKKRNYVAELLSLQGRVATAGRLLEKALEPDAPHRELIEVALEELRGPS